MSAPFNPYAPRDQTVVDVIMAARRAIDEMTRSNPLQSAVVSSGLIKWLGNYPNAGSSDPINFLWIGEFLPADPDMGGAAQRGFSLVRDDSRGGISALAMYDPSPDAAGSNLRQVLIMTSGDGVRMFEESRDGGQRWPEETMWLGPIGDDTNLWPGAASATFATLWEGRGSLVGNRLKYRVFCANGAGTSGEYRMRVSLASGDVTGPTHTLGSGAQNVFDDEVDVAAGRGETVAIRWEARRTAGANKTRASVISARCYTP